MYIKNKKNIANNKTPKMAQDNSYRHYVKTEKCSKEFIVWYPRDGKSNKVDHNAGRQTI